MIRGIVMALIIASASAGGVVYLQVSKLFYESNPNMVFGLIFLMDSIALIFMTASIFMGMYGDPPKNMELGGDEASRVTEADQETYFDKDIGFGDEIADAPFGEIYD